MSSADVVYYNLTIGNNSIENEGKLTNPYINANINALNNIPILGNPDEYYGSIIRFQIPAITLPLLNVLIQTPVLDINKTVFSFAITDALGLINGAPATALNTTQSFVLWEPQVNVSNDEIPKVGTALQTFSPYYLCYSYNWFIRLWNEAISIACSAYPIAIVDVPFFKFDPTTQLISLYATVQFSFGGLRLWINNNFLNYFVGMPKLNVNISPINNPFGLDNSLIIDNYPLDAVPSLPNYFRNSYEYNAFGYWNFFKSIIITTSMNVNSEIVFNNSLGGSQNVNYVNILEDYYPDLALQNGAGVSSQIFTFNASSLYRIFQFNEKTPLYRIQLAISVVDGYGNIYPLELPKGQLANFKLMFIKKSIYANYNKNLN